MATRDPGYIHNEQYARLTSLNGNILKVRRNDNINVFEHIKGLVDNEYKYQILPDSTGPHFARILKVLKGPDTVGHGPTKTMNLREEQKKMQELMLSEALFDEKLRGAEQNPVRVLAKVYDIDLDLDFKLPPPHDKLLESLHGEFWAIGNNSSFNSIQEGQLVVVSLPNKESRTSSLTGGPAGLLLGVADETVVSRMVSVVELAGLKIDKDCKPPVYNDAGVKKAVVDTYSESRLLSPSFKYIKSINKTGIYGGGSSQTKSHFTSILKNSVLPSAKLLIGGPALDGENAFIWVGHLKNNGYLDLLDRPISPGRETIIYASKMLDITQPIEIKYYLHDKAGFGSAWAAGPNTLPTNVINDVGDFKTKIAPAIKDLIKLKRNVVLVIPEMLYSLGYGTKSGDVARLKAIAQGDAVLTQGRPGPEATIRTKISFSTPKIRSELSKYLNSIPVKTNENLLQVSRLQQRELSTFDGSLTAGNFAGMHQEVLDVLQNYLGITYDSVNFVSVIADGLAAVTLAALSKNTPQSATHTKARQDFLSLPIDRFDFISRGVDKSRYFFLDHFAPIQFFQDNLRQRSLNNPLKNIEFNYITTEEEANSSEGAARSFFTHGNEVNNQFNMSVSGDVFNAAVRPPNQAAGEKKLTKQINNLTINLHIVRKKVSNKKEDYAVGHAMAYETGTEPKRSVSSYSQVSTSPMPNHAAAVSSRTGPSATAEMLVEQEELFNKIEYFSGAIATMAGDVSNLCKDEKYKRYCKKDLLYFGQDGEFIKEHKDWWNNLKRLITIDRLINYEIFLQNQTRTQQAALQELSVKETELGLAKSDVDKTFANSIAIVGIPNLSYKETWKKLTTYFNPDIFQNKNNAIAMFYGTINQPPGQNESVLSNGLIIKMAELDALELELAKAKQRVEQLKALGAPSAPSDCEEVPSRIAESPYQVPGVDATSTAPVTLCNGKKFKEPFSTAEEIIEHIPYAPKKTDFTFNSVKTTTYLGEITANVSTTQTKIKDAIPAGSLYQFEAAKFWHQVRGRNNATRKIKGDVLVWSCLAPRLEKAWAKACRDSGYYPFSLASGLVGSYEKGGIVGYDSGISPAAYGLAINIDPFLSIDTNIPGEASTSVWTGAMTPGIGGHPKISKKLFDMGVFNEDYFKFPIYNWDLNRGGFDARAQLQVEQILKEVPSRYNIPSVQKVLNRSSGSPIVPIGGYPLSNPTRWMISFCEASGMKWGNSFFLLRRFVRGEWRLARGSNAWTPKERSQLDKIYGIKDIVDKVNSISWPSDLYPSVDNHSYLQFWNPSSPPVNAISWSQLEQESLQTKVKILNSETDIFVAGSNSSAGGVA